MSRTEPTNAPQLPAPGDVLDGRFHLREVLGDGGMGQVYRAYDEAAGREVALKLLIPRYLGRPEREIRMLREAELGRRIKHPHLVTYLDSGRLVEHDWPFIVSELVRGNDLGLMLALNPISSRLVARIARQLAGALRAIHAAGVVHRDVTSANVLLDGSHATLIDLSHAGDVALPQVPAGQPGRLTRLHEVPGTHMYMSREQANADPADPSMDVFAYGVTLIHMLTGVPPDDYGREEYIAMQRRGTLKSPRIDPSASPETPVPLVELANACVEQDAAKRPTMVEIVDRLDRLLAAMVMPAEPTRQIEAANDVAVTAREPDAPQLLRRSKAHPPAVPPMIDADARSKPTSGALAPAVPDSSTTDTSAQPKRRGAVALLALLVGALVVAVVVLSLMLANERGAREPADAPAVVSSESGSTGATPQASTEPDVEPSAPMASTTEAEASGDDADLPAPAEQETPVEAIEPAPSEPKKVTPEPSKRRPPKPAKRDCGELRADVDRAVAERNWRTVLRLTRSGACWNDRVPRIDLRVQALKQLRRWNECIELAKTVDSVESSRVARGCAAALEASNE